MNSSPRVCLVGSEADQNFSDCFKLLNSLSLLWKFQVCVLDSVDELFFEDTCRLYIVTYSNKSFEFEHNFVCKIAENKNIRVLLCDTTPKVYDSEFSSFFGLTGIERCAHTVIEKIIFSDSDVMTSGLLSDHAVRFESIQDYGVIKFSESVPLITDIEGKCYFSNYNATFCYSLPIWQFGAPTFPQFFVLLRNLIFFADSIGHFSPFPYYSLRIDDYPLTSEQYILSNGVSDTLRADEIKELCVLTQEFDAYFEFMVNSHILCTNNELLSIQDVVPQSCEILKKYHRGRVININAHGRSHVDEHKFMSSRSISPLEFSNLSVAETKFHIYDCINFISSFFEKKVSGFVPPCWSYQEGVTKNICTQFFSYIVDSGNNYRFGKDCEPMGFVDNTGMLHLFETWHLGSKFFFYSDQSLWKSFMSCGIPVHMMAHGPYLSDPLPSAKSVKYLLLLALTPFLPLLILINLRAFYLNVKALGSSVKWDRLGFFRKVFCSLPFFRRHSLRHLLKVGARHGASWIFTEDLASHLREFAVLKVLRCYWKESRIHVIFSVDMNCAGPFLYHVPSRVVDAQIDSGVISIGESGRSLQISNISAGEHHLIVGMES